MTAPDAAPVPYGVLAPDAYPEPGSAPVAALIITHNEELHLPHVLPSVQWCREVYVVDSYSTDRTEEIARRHGATFVQHVFESCGQQWDWAVRTLPQQVDWVFLLDADHIVTPELAAEVERVGEANPPGPVVGCWVPDKFIFMGRWIRHAGFYPKHRLRAFHRRFGHVTVRPGSETVVCDGETAVLRGDNIHHNRKGLYDYVGRHNPYAYREALSRQTHQREPGRALGTTAERVRWIRNHIWPLVPWWARAPARFVQTYILSLGILDGGPGLVFCGIQAYYEFLVNAYELAMACGHLGEVPRAVGEGPAGRPGQGGA